MRAGVGTAVQVAAGLLLMLAGWGLGDLRAFFGDPARMGFVALGLLGAGAAVAWGVEMQPLRKGLLPTGRQGVELGVLLGLALLLLWFLPYADRRSLFAMHSLRVRYAGLALCTIGGVVRLVALRRLGPHFSAYVTLQAGHRLVREGIYASIRHPLYLSLLLVPAGIAMVFGSWLALPAFVLSVIFVAERIGREERLLAEEFGEEFADYRRRSWFLIPWLL
jgi:protein-S-isoprenylcysteine O-methyltransferase Ste14